MNNHSPIFNKNGLILLMKHALNNK